MSKKLVKATGNGDIDTVKSLLNDGHDIDYYGDSNVTALICAAYNGDFDVVKLLISEGADLTIADKDGTAFDNAMLKGHIEIAEFIKEAEKKIIGKL